MSFYFKNRFIISDHARVRIKERIKKYKNEKDFIIDNDINNLLSILNPKFSTKQHFYFEHPKQQGFYFVVCKKQKLILTFSKISYDKFLRLK